MIQQVIFPSKILKNKRRIFIYVPPHADLMRGPTLPVLYMQDGQNLFANTCREVPFQWELDQVADMLIERGAIPRLLIVGLANTAQRENEYTHTRCDHFKTGGRADRYLDFVTEEVMPFIAENFPINRSRQATAFGGSSLGGLLALYAACTRYRHFGRFIATSPSIWWDNFSIFKVMQHGGLNPKLVKLWVDIGRREMKGVHHKGKLFRPLRLYRHLDETLQLMGFQKGKNYRYFEERLGVHDERSWGRRMRRALPFLFKDLNGAARRSKRRRSQQC